MIPNKITCLEKLERNLVNEEKEKRILVGWEGLNYWRLLRSDYFFDTKGTSPPPSTPLR